MTDTKSDLEKEFERQYKRGIAEIDIHLTVAREAIDKACQRAEAYGIPFSADVSPLGQGYIPASFREKFPDVSDEFVSEITGVYDRNGDELYSGGWQHSDVC